MSLNNIDQLSLIVQEFPEIQKKKNLIHETSQKSSQRNDNQIFIQSLDKSILSENSHIQPSHQIDLQNTDRLDSNINVQLVDQDSQDEIISDSDNSFLNISFQEIVGLLAENESPHLQNSIRSSINNSNLIILGFIFYFWSAIVIISIALFKELSESTSPLMRLESTYFFLKLLSTSLIIYSLMHMRYIISGLSQQEPGDISQIIIEFLKYTIRNNIPFEGDYFDEEQLELTQAQYVAKSIAKKIRTFNWINFLINHESGHMYSVNRIIFLSESLLFVWGNSVLIQYEQVQQFGTLCLMYSLLLQYFITVSVMITVILLIGAVPLMLVLIIWQSCNCVSLYINNLYRDFKLKDNAQKRENFLKSLIKVSYSEFKFKDDNDTCVICLGQYYQEDNVISLPCNVVQINGGQINHYFHSDCIGVWIEEHGNCPVCRKQFIEKIEDEQ